MNESITIKLSTDADRDRLRELAELDGRGRPAATSLLAEVNGRLIAAIGMDGTVVADPFERTAGSSRCCAARSRTGPRAARLVRGGLLAILVAVTAPA